MQTSTLVSLSPGTESQCEPEKSFLIPEGDFCLFSLFKPNLI